MVSPTDLLRSSRTSGSTSMDTALPAVPVVCLAPTVVCRCPWARMEKSPEWLKMAEVWLESLMMENGGK